MRNIRGIAIVTSEGIKRYTIGDEVNGLIITSIISNPMEMPDRLEIGYLCYGDFGYGNSNLIVEIWNVPVIVEYMEVL